MGKTILIAGKDSPAGDKFVEGFSASGRNVVVTRAETEEEVLRGLEKKTAAEKRAEALAIEEAQVREAATGVFHVAWNRPSSVSARTLVLQTENAYGMLDEAVLFFDEDFYAQNAERIDPAECSRGCDELIVPYQLLTLELISRFEKKNAESAPATLVFLLKEGPCVADSVRSPVLRNGVNALASPIVAAAASAFCTFAENIAAVYGDSTFVDILLVRGDSTQELARNDRALATWLAGYLDSAGQRSKGSAKKSVAWGRIGDKGAGAFSARKLFGR